MVPHHITISPSDTSEEAFEELMSDFIVDDASGRVGIQLALNGVLHDRLGPELAHTRPPLRLSNNHVGLTDVSGLSQGVEGVTATRDAAPDA